MTLLAAFGVLLHHITGQDDICLGAPVANRRSETEGLIGMFVDTTVLRLDLGGNPTFRELLVRIREMTLAAYAHQDLPFEKLLRELGIAQPRGPGALFQGTLVLHDVPKQVIAVADLSLELLAIEGGIPAFDLSLDVRKRQDGFLVSLMYDANLFNAATIQCMAEQFRKVLEGIVACPEQEIQMLGDSIRGRVDGTS
jgi:non-ribosomal peptide synthetase component F